ncbi:MAG: RagB/SusD family nutrient uptake outer membrane protein [Sphingobacteriales bacterium]|nr:RagB/SusD family nutrient uptake outer membrane protein [Sphingobacteriales bacterium]
MKKIYIILLGFAFIAGGCKKYLDIKPVNEQPDTYVLQTKANVLAVLYAAYDRVQADKFVGGRSLIAAELYSDNVDMTTSSLVSSQDYGPFSNRNFGIFNNVGRDVWSTGYSAIYNANIVIDAVDKNLFPDATDAEKAVLKAEALFIRAISHHNLVRVFALPYSNNPATDPGVPLRITRPTPAEALIPVPRAKVGEVYQQIITDLKAAESILPATNGGRATSWAAKALLARVYFDMGDYVNAYSYANDVISNGGFTLGASVTLPFRNVGPSQALGGVIFQVINMTGDDNSSKLRGEFWNTNAANIIFYVDPAFYLSFAPADARRNSLINPPGANKAYSLKYMGSNPVNIPIIRLAEMLLTRAESAVRKGGYVAADVRADYNSLRTLAGLAPDLLSSTDAELLAAIQSERRFELATEGDRYYELRRLKQNIRGLAYNDKLQLLKIPDSETRANPDIEQN